MATKSGGKPRVTGGTRRRSKKPTPEHAAVVRTHDGGENWEAACSCGYRSPQGANKGTAEEALQKHLKGTAAK